jgi:hypothetical protein
VELTNGQVGTTNGINIEWRKCAYSPVVSWEYAVVYDHTELKTTHVDGDWYQYSQDRIKWSDTKSQLFSPDLMYRKHPHNDLMKSYAAGEQWQFTYVDNPDDDAWINCKDAPKWDEAASYRKKPEIMIIKLYRVPGTTVYHTSPNFELIEETFQRIK